MPEVEKKTGFVRCPGHESQGCWTCFLNGQKISSPDGKCWVDDDTHFLCLLVQGVPEEFLPQPIKRNLNQ